VKIAITHPGGAYLPELEAYREYFQQSSHSVDVFTAAEHRDLLHYTVEWRLLGQDLRPSSPCSHLIHDYRGVPLPPFSRLKTRLKVRSFRKPSLRVFLNALVRDAYGFKDDVPELIMDMGVDPAFINAQRKPVYDAVYVGELSPRRQISGLLNEFGLGGCRKYSILLVGQPPPELYARFKSCKNICFAGKVAYQEVPSLLASARVGINYIPLIYPFTIQTSTKFLEYLATGLATISTFHLPSVNLARKLGHPIWLVRSITEVAAAMDKAIESDVFIPTQLLTSLTWQSVFESVNLVKRVEGLAATSE